ncbi:MAG: SLBB domain-containing protein [Prevotella sp.]|nr:SLBB domain-containing protein [Prevotella sp.]
MRKICLFAWLLWLGCGTAQAQSLKTDDEVKNQVLTLHNRGLSRQQIYLELRQQGLSDERIRSIYEKYSSQIDNNPTGQSTATADMSGVSRMRAANGDLRSEELNTYSDSAAVVAPTDGHARKIFGHDVFNNKNLTFQSSMNLATPQNYTLGPGDVVNIDIWGAAQESVSVTISPDGTITVPDVGVVRLGGLSVSQAKARLKAEIGPRYQDSKIELTLGQTRTITVSVIGEVKVPATYTLSAFSTVFNALYMAGGPNDIGTLRNIKVYRKGNLLSNIDVYDFLLNGKLTGDVRLQDNDVITVGPYETLVCITGKVKRPMYYEMKDKESISTLLRYAGGFAGDAHTRALRVLRKSEPSLSVFSVGDFDYNSFRLMDGDVVDVDSVLNRYQNMVEVKGAVFRPGLYQVGGDITTVKGLLEAAAGLKEDAISTRGVLQRMKSDRTREVISVNLRGILDGTASDVALHNEDVLFIASREVQNRLKTVTVHGEVYNPGIFPYAEHMTVEDLILQAGGPTEAASLAKIDVSRCIKNPNATQSGDSITTIYSFSLDPEFNIDRQTNFGLQPFDEVYVRRSPDYNTPQNVRIEGEVQFAGTYALTNKTQRLSEVVKRAGGLTNRAYIEGAKLLRQMTHEEQSVMETVLRTATRNSGSDTIDISKLNLLPNYPVGMELEKALLHPGTDDDPILRDGDRIVVPVQTSTVTINGEVIYPNTIRFKEGKKARYYIKQAGGYTSTAKKSKAIIIYMNGMVAKANSKNKPRPGCQIVVPTKKKGKSLTLPEILSIGTTSASLGTMVAAVANLIKN